MSKESTEIQNLLRLKRYEQPSDEYFEEFVEEFHRRQREDLVKCSARSLFLERLSVWFKELGMARWAYGAGVAYAALMIGFVAWPKASVEGPTASPNLPGNRTLEHVEFETPLQFDENAPKESTELSEF